MTRRKLRALYIALVIFEWAAFGLAGALFVYDCCTFNTAGAIGNLLGAAFLFVFNVVTWPRDNQVIESLADLPDDSDYESLVIEGKDAS